MLYFARFKLVSAVAFVVGAFAAAGVAKSGGGKDEGVTLLEPITVFGQYSSYHDVTNESELVGPAKQPEWTTRRAFAETDIYVIPPGEIEFNQFDISSHPREGKPENLFESELEFGLPWRTQLDIEPNYRIEEGRLIYDSTRIEGPHALADSGRIPLNPALDVRWRFNHEEDDSYLFRLLLAEQLGERCIWEPTCKFKGRVRIDPYGP